jgi:hypothetical protein
MGIGTIVTRFVVEEDGSVTWYTTAFNDKLLPEQPCREDASRSLHVINNGAAIDPAPG